MKKRIAIGADVGGSHISCAAFDFNTRKYLENTFSENDVDNHAEAEVIIDTWGSTIRQTIVKAGIENITGIGFAMPGPFDYENGIPLFTGANDKYEKIYGINVPHELHHYLGLPTDFPIRFINDATAFAIGEDWVGQAKGYRRFLSITLGTGFGSAFLSESLPVVTGSDVPANGCVWHLPFEDGIADDYFSTRGLVSRYAKLSGRLVKDAREVAEAAGTDEVAKAVFSDFGSKLVDLLKPWLIKFNVEVMVVGGNISRAHHLFFPALHVCLLREGLRIKVGVSELKGTASIIGSARLVEPDFWNRISPLLKEM